MENLNEILITISILIKQYPFYYFGITSLILTFLIFYLIKNINKDKIIIKKIKSLLSRNSDKAFNNLIKSDLAIIDYFLTKENLNSNEYIKIKEYLSEPEQVKKIYDKIISGKNKENRIKKGISILSKLKVSQASNYLITFLYEDNKDTIKMVLAELKYIQTDKVIYSLIEFIKYTKDNDILSTLMDTLKEMGDEAIKKIIPLIYKADPSTKICYIDIIGEYLNDEYYQVLVDLLDIDNPEVKIHVIQKLVNYKLDDDIINKFITLLEDEHWGVRSQTIKVLEKQKLNKLAPFLAKRLTDKSGIVRVSATEALLNLGYEGVRYIFELAKKPEAPIEVKDALKKQDIAFLIEALENVYQNDIKKTETVSQN